MSDDKASVALLRAARRPPEKANGGANAREVGAPRSATDAPPGAKADALATQRARRRVGMRLVAQTLLPARAAHFPGRRDYYSGIRFIYWAELQVACRRM